MDCKEEYTVDSGRTFTERYKEHMKALSLMQDHNNTTDHDISIDNFSIMGREDQNLARFIKEAIFIRANEVSLNINIAKTKCNTYWMRY